MTYYEERVQNLMESRIEDYNFPSSTAEPALWEFFKEVIFEVSKKNKISIDSFLYYERTVGSKRILGFRMPDTNSYLIYTCCIKKKNGSNKYTVSVAGLDGEEAIPYFEASAKYIIPFFKEMEQIFTKNDSHSTFFTVDIRTGKFRKKTSPLTYSNKEYLSTDSISKSK